MLFGKSLECISFGYRQIKVTLTNVLTERMKQPAYSSDSFSYMEWFKEAGTAPLDKQIKRKKICLKNLDTIFISIL